MKRSVLVLAAILMAMHPAYGRATDVQSEAQQSPRARMDAQKQMMQKLAFLVGDWEGERRTFMPDGSVAISRSSNEIALIVEGDVLTIHGRGYAAGSSVAENEQFGLIHFDDVAGHYVLRAYGLGSVSTTDVDWVQEGAAQWTATLPDALMRFNIVRVDADHWNETISVSHDNGESWRKAGQNFFKRRHCEKQSSNEARSN